MSHKQSTIKSMHSDYRLQTTDYKKSLSLHPTSYIPHPTSFTPLHLYLIRHAKSSWSDPSLDDFDRGLKRRGKDDIAFMAKWLKNRVEVPDLILSSPAKRAKKTLKAIKKEFDLDKKDILFDDRIYEASLDDLLDILTSLKSDKKRVFLIGHNPSLNELAEFLSGVYLSNIPTSGIVGVKFDTDKWSDLASQKGKMIFFEYPKKLKSRK